MKALVVALTLVSGAAHAQGLRLRGDALAGTPSPVGLLVLSGEDRERDWMSAEALVWVDDEEADALAISLTLRDPAGRGELRLGRQVMTVGALRPLHADGALLRARYWQGTAELFAGLPVVAAFGPRSYDWAVGARLAERVGPAQLGVAWMERRDHGVLDTRELGADLSVLPDGPWDLAASAAYDLVDPGLAELRVSTAYRLRAWRFELFGLTRSPARLLPATSLFSVLGDVPSTRAGGVVRWRAAPRLDVWLGAGGHEQDDELDPEASLRTVLRLDEAGEGRLGLELRKDAGWSGVRGTARLPLPFDLVANAEAELALVDDDVWPWGLAALSWSHAGWETQAAVEASSSPRDEYRIDVLARLSRAWELPR